MLSAKSFNIKVVTLAANCGTNQLLEVFLLVRLELQEELELKEES